MSSTSTTRKNSRGLITQDRLIAAAQVCFGELGYSRTRISDIAERAVVSQGNFYRHFDGKAGIFLEALRPSLNELSKVTRTELSLGTDAAAVTPMLVAYLTTYRLHRHLLKVMREAAALGEPDGFVEAWLSERAKFVRRLDHWLLDQPKPATTDPAAGAGHVARRAEALGSMIEQVAYVHFGLPVSEPSDHDIEDWAETLAELMVNAKRGIVTSAARADEA